ncbi:MAG: YgiQ family radical SAM protein [Rikenellaceae bacterium]
MIENNKNIKIDRSRENNYGFLPTSAKEVKQLGWDYIDVILFTGDAYVDHPSFGIAVIARHLEAAGYRVAVVAQPSWHGDLRDFKKLGTPRLFFGVSAGNMDSMVNHYTAARRLRSDDAYTPDSRAGARPDYATKCYTKILKELYPDTPVVIGGIEASLRRLTHYDYWQDRLFPSILADSGADLLMYGMGDKSIVDVAEAFKHGYDPNKLHNLHQIAFLSDTEDSGNQFSGSRIVLNSFEKCIESKRAFGDNFKVIEIESNKIEAKQIVEKYGDKYVVVNPPYPPFEDKELDYTYSLPFTRTPHHRYRGKGAISAYEMIKFSVNIHRGCFGGCSFCTISAHQGKQISSRSEESIIDELKAITELDGFKGMISDLGGPSANMWKMHGRNRDLCQKCARHSCLHPKVCKNLENSHLPIIKLYEKASQVDGIKKIYIGSGIRYDLFDARYGAKYLEEVVVNHTSGRFKVAPEHTSDKVLMQMRKPSFSLFEQLCTDFNNICKRKSLRYEIVPYFISSHPACTLEDMRELHKKIKGLHFDLRQVQDFTPTPMTLSSVIYYTGEDPYTNEKVFVEKNLEKKREQKELFFVKKEGYKGGNSSRGGFVKEPLSNPKAKGEAKKREFKGKEVRAREKYREEKKGNNLSKKRIKNGKAK